MHDCSVFFLFFVHCIQWKFLRKLISDYLQAQQIQKISNALFNRTNLPSHAIQNITNHTSMAITQKRRINLSISITRYFQHKKINGRSPKNYELNFIFVKLVAISKRKKKLYSKRTNENASSSFQCTYIYKTGKKLHLKKVRKKMKL